MKITTLKPILLPEGKLKVGAVVELPEALARFFLERGEAEHWVDPNPSLAVGIPSSASPAAPVLPQTTPSALESGGKKRGRPRKVEASL